MLGLGDFSTLLQVDGRNQLFEVSMLSFDFC
jgi:hypothetical protein